MFHFYDFNKPLLHTIFMFWCYQSGLHTYIPTKWTYYLNTLRTKLYVKKTGR